MRCWNAGGAKANWIFSWNKQTSELTSCILRKKKNDVFLLPKLDKKRREKLIPDRNIEKSRKRKVK